MADARDRKEHLTATDGGYFVIDEVDAAHTDTSDNDADTAAEAADAVGEQAAEDAAASDEAVLEKDDAEDEAPVDDADEDEPQENVADEAAEDAEDAGPGDEDAAGADDSDDDDTAAPQVSDSEDDANSAAADKDEDDESALFEHDVVDGEADEADSEDADPESAALTTVLPVVEDADQKPDDGLDQQLESAAKKRSPLDAVRKQADAVVEYFKDQQAMERPQGRVLLGEDAVLHELPEHEEVEVDKDDLIGPSQAHMRSALPYSSFGTSPSETAGKNVRIDRRLGLTLGIVAVVLVIAFAIVAAVAANAAKQGAVVASLSSRVGLTLKIDAKGLDERGSMVPVSVTGTTASGEAVDKVVYVDTEGKGIFVAPGTYELTIVGSPIAANGTIYEVPDSGIEVDVPAADEAVVESTFKLKPISASKTTEEQIDDAYQAIADGGCEPDKAVELKLKASERAGIED